jgi:hypothetical protein
MALVDVSGRVSLYPDFKQSLEGLVAKKFSDL